MPTDPVTCQRCGKQIPGFYAAHPWCAWCVKAQADAERHRITIKQPRFGTQPKRPRPGGQA